MRLLFLFLATVLALPAAARAETKITFLYTAVAPSLTAFVAKDQGLFARHGLDVDLVLAQNGSVIMAGVAAGSGQIGLPTPSVFLQAVDGGLDQVAIAATNIFPETARSGVVARPSAGVKAPADLIGHKVGVPGIGGLLDVVFRRWLGTAKVDPSRVVYVETTFPQMPDLLRSGQVDAVVATDPFFSRMLESGVGISIGDPASSLPAGAPGSLYAANREWVDQNKATVSAFQAALLEAVEAIHANEPAAREALAHYVKLPPAVLATVAIPNVSVRLSPEQLRIWIDICREQKMIGNDLDPVKLVVPWAPAK